MKRICLLAGVTLTASSLCFGQQSFRIICKGGPDMKIRISPGDARNSYQKLGLFFTKSRRAAGQNGAALQNGTCAWVDRPMNAREPDILAQDIRPGYQYHVDLDASRHVMRFRPTNNSYNWVNVLQLPGKLWTFLRSQHEPGRVQDYAIV